jgi:UDP-N-acetylmuramoylalanine-D-glutamate ligase
MTLGDILALAPNQKIAIIGLGKENLQFLKWLLDVAKIKPEQIILADQKELDLDYGCDTFYGENYLDCLKIPDIEYVFKAPGIWSLKPEFETFRKTKGADRVNSSLLFFVQNFRDQIIGITGTKGKSTTSSLINHLLNSFEDSESIYCGNTTGISPYQFWTDLTQKPRENKFYVVELSSFQLQDLAFASISPKYGVITNYFIDHLDQHATREEYWAAKDALFTSQSAADTIIISPTVFLHSQNQSKLSKAILIDSNSPSELFSFIKSPLLGDHNQQNVNQAVAVVASVKLKSGGQVGDLTDLTEEIKKNKFKYQSAINRFKGLTHRLELVRSTEREININKHQLKLRINFYDDGYATEPDAVAAAIKALTQKNGEFLWLQISGKDKGSELEDLVTTILYKEIENKTYRIDYCGSVGQRLLNELYKVLGTSQTVPLEIFKDTIEKSFLSLEQIQNHFATWLQELLDNYSQIGEFNKTHEILSRPEIVLNIALSPCGSSFDEFENYTIRSQWWVEKVRNLE